MSLGNATENDVMKALMHGTALPAYGAARQVNFHTADPGEAGVATTSAPTWAGYAAVSTTADNTAWTLCDPDTPYNANVNGPAVKNAVEVTFPECTGGGPESMTHASISIVATGQIIVKGALNNPLTVDLGGTPRFPVGTFVFKLD